MPKVRTPVFGIAHGAVLGIASWCAAAEAPSDSRREVGVTSSLVAAEGAEPVHRGDEITSLWRFEADAGAALRSTDVRQLSPPSDEPAQAEPALPTGDAEGGGIVDLRAESPTAYASGYNLARSATTWLPGDGNRFGWFSYESIGGARIDDLPSLVTGFGVHFLDGPSQTDMPPRLFDFTIGVGDRRLIQPNISYDIVACVGAFSDFEGSARDGVRYPSHAVTFFRLNPSNELVLGIDCLDRDDIRLLPVVGTIWSPQDWLRVEAVFPRPRVAARIYESTTWIYLGGELGGGTWAIERVNLDDDNATYRDLRLVFGWETLHPESLRSSFEIGYVFDRRLSYSSGVGDYDPPNGFMVRMTATY